MSPDTLDQPGDTVLSPEGLEARLRAIGDARYHDKHPFHRMLHNGELDRGQVQAWALNRYYYQASIPLKDAALMARCPDSDIRRIWRQRMVDHDGEAPGQGGIQRWLRLTDGLGLDRDYVTSLAGLLPATRFAVDAYVHFVAQGTLLEAIASSLTELFSPTIIAQRLTGMLRHYDFVSTETLAYFDARLSQAPRDADFALDYVKRNAQTVEQQKAICDALIFKTQVLWAQLDALHFAYVAPGLTPPGAFRPGES